MKTEIIAGQILAYYGEEQGGFWLVEKIQCSHCKSRWIAAALIIEYLLGMECPICHKITVENSFTYITPSA